MVQKCLNAMAIKVYKVQLYLDTGVQLLQLRHMHDKYTRFHCLLHVESHVTQLTFGPGQELRKKNLAATQATIP